MQPPLLGASPVQVGAVNRDRKARPFWSVSGCSRCGSIRDQESDEYYGDDMHLVHLKWRGSNW
jgi:hypothetical protein